MNSKLFDNPLEKELNLLSKGDNNPVDDRGLYPRNILWLKKKDIIGKIRAYCPYVGYLTILLNDNPPIKYAVLGLMLLSVYLNKEA